MGFGSFNSEDRYDSEGFDESCLQGHVLVRYIESEPKEDRYNTIADGLANFQT